MVGKFLVAICEFVIEYAVRINNVERLRLYMKIKAYVDGFVRYRYLLQNLISRDIKVKYRRSVLGLAWSILNPLLMMVVMTIVFSNLFRFDIENYPIYYLSGSLLFNFFSEATNGAMMSILSSAGLIRKVYIPKYIFTMEKVLFAFVNLLFSFVAIIVMMLVLQIKITPLILLFPIPLLYLLVFSLGVGLILSCYTVFFRDISHLYGVVLTAWMFLTPIFYPESVMREHMSWALTFNPLFQFIRYFRNVLLYGQMPTLQNNFACFIPAVVALVVGLYVFKKNQDKFVLYM